MGEALLRCCYDSSTNLVSPCAECPHPHFGKRSRIAENSAVGGGADHEVETISYCTEIKRKSGISSARHLQLLRTRGEKSETDDARSGTTTSGPFSARGPCQYATESGPSAVVRDLGSTPLTSRIACCSFTPCHLIDVYSVGTHGPDLHSPAAIALECHPIRVMSDLRQLRPGPSMRESATNMSMSESATGAVLAQLSEIGYLCL